MLLNAGFFSSPGPSSSQLTGTPVSYLHLMMPGVAGRLEAQVHEEDAHQEAQELEVEHLSSWVRLLHPSIRLPLGSPHK